MALTDEEKLEIKNDVLDAIKSESQSVDELPVVDSLDGITSLPTMRGEELVSAPITLLSKPATDAAAVANASAKKADTAAVNANQAAQTVVDYVSRATDGLKGATARFNGIVDDATINAISVAEITAVFFIKAKNVFAGYSADYGYCNNWGSADLYMNEERTAILKDKIYLLGGSGYVWDDEEGTLVEGLGGEGDGATAPSWKDSVVELGGVVSDVTVVDSSCMGGVAVYAEDLGRIVYLLGGTYYSGMSGNTAWVDSSGNAHVSKLYRAGGELWIATGSGSQLQRLVYPDACRLWLLGDDGNPLGFKAEANCKVLAMLSATEPGAAVKLQGVDAEGAVDGVWMGDGTVDVLMHGFTRRYTFDADGLSSWQDLSTATEGSAGGWIAVV